MARWSGVDRGGLELVGMVGGGKGLVGVGLWRCGREGRCHMSTTLISRLPWG